MEHNTPPTSYYLKNGNPYNLQEEGKIHVDAEANRFNPELIRLRDVNGIVTLLYGEWIDERGRYEYTVKDGMSIGGKNTKNFIEQVKSKNIK